MPAADIDAGEGRPSGADPLKTCGGTTIPTTIDGRRVRLTDLLDAGLVSPGTRQIWERGRLGQTFRASFTDNGSIQLDDGRTYSSPSWAAMAAADVASFDGWYAWRVDAPNGKLLHEIRTDLLDQYRGTGAPIPEPDSLDVNGDDPHVPGKDG